MHLRRRNANMRAINNPAAQVSPAQEGKAVAVYQTLCQMCAFIKEDISFDIQIMVSLLFPNHLPQHKCTQMHGMHAAHPQSIFCAHHAGVFVYSLLNTTCTMLLPADSVCHPPGDCRRWGACRSSPTCPAALLRSTAHASWRCCALRCLHTPQPHPHPLRSTCWSR